MTTKKMILDLDVGIDDALAIAYADYLQKKGEVEFLAIISSYGNTTSQVAAENASRLLTLLGNTNTKVFLGASHNTSLESFDVMDISRKIHGENGIGNVDINDISPVIESKDAVDYLIESAEKHGSNLIFVPTGPLTNLSIAREKNSEAIEKIGNITLMGGALTVPGNVTPFTEANINQDVISANDIFQNQKYITMVGLDVTLKTLLTKNHTSKWRNINNKKAITFANIMDYYIDAYDTLGINHDGAALHDPLAVAVALDPNLVSTIFRNLKVTNDPSTSDVGRTIGDLRKLREPSTTKIAIDIDQDNFVDIFQKVMLEELSD